MSIAHLSNTCSLVSIFTQTSEGNESKKSRTRSSSSRIYSHISLSPICHHLALFLDVHLDTVSSPSVYLYSMFSSYTILCICFDLTRLAWITLISLYLYIYIYICLCIPEDASSVLFGGSSSSGTKKKMSKRERERMRDLERERNGQWAVIFMFFVVDIASK